MENYISTVDPDPAKVLIVPGEEDTIDFTNTRMLSDVTVEKIVKGHIVHSDREFLFTATLWDGETQIAFPSGEMMETFSLKHEESIIFRDLFVGAKLSIIETEDADFTTVNTHGEGSKASYVVKAQDNDTVTYTNTVKTAPVTVSKVVKGGIIDKEREFLFTVTLWNGDQQIVFPREIGEELSVSDDGKTVSFLLKHGEEAVIQNLPLGATVKVSEAEDPFYTAVNNFFAGRDAEVKLTDVNGKIVRYENTLRNTQLTITNEVIGNLGDREAPFTFVMSMKDKYGDPVAFTAPEGVAYDPQTHVATFTLKHGEQITFTEVPVGANVVVDEDEGRYKATAVLNGNDVTGPVNNGKFKFAIEDIQPDVLDVTNELNVSLDTGIAMDSTPFVVILMVVAAGCVLLFVRKRKVED